MRMRLTRLVARLALLLTGAVAAGTLAAAPAAAVADGTPAAPGQYPYAVRLAMTGIPRPDGSRYDSACSAALVSPTWIVTAGHCFHDVNRVRVSGPVPYPTTATLNTVDLARSAGETRSVVAVRQAASADVALAQLSSPVTDVRPIGLATTRPTTGQLLTLAGWGATSSVNPAPGSRLITGTVRITGVGSGTVLVTGYSPARDTSACLYDSGAPYLRTVAGRPQLVSVENTGPDCPHTLNETTARIDPLVPWIRSVVPDLP